MRALTVPRSREHCVRACEAVCMHTVSRERDASVTGGIAARTARVFVGQCRRARARTRQPCHIASGNQHPRGQAGGVPCIPTPSTHRATWHTSWRRPPAAALHFARASSMPLPAAWFRALALVGGAGAELGKAEDALKLTEAETAHARTELKRERASLQAHNPSRPHPALRLSAGTARRRKCGVHRAQP